MSLAAVLVGMALAAGPADARHEVAASVDRFAVAFRTGDVGTIEALVAPSYSHSNSDGTHPSREAWLAWLETRAEAIRTGTFVYSEYRNEDVAIAVHGDAAVVSGVNVSAGVDAGQPFDKRLRFTQVWVRDATGWRRVAFHDSALASSGR